MEETNTEKEPLNLAEWYEAIKDWKNGEFNEEVIKRGIRENRHLFREAISTILDNYDNQTVLQLAAKLDCGPMAQWLIDEGKLQSIQDCKTTWCERRDPVQIAANCGSKDVIAVFKVGLFPEVFYLPIRGCVKFTLVARVNQEAGFSQTNTHFTVKIEVK